MSKGMTRQKTMKQMRAPTKTQLQIAQELLRRDLVVQMKTTQDEYLKFGDSEYRVFWVGRRGELRMGQRLVGSNKIYWLFGLKWQGMVRDAKANYREENDKK